MSRFQIKLDTTDWDHIKSGIYQCSDDVVVQTLTKAASASALNLQDFQALISPAAEPYLETMAKISQKLTQQKFGKTMLLYVPLYLSNKCSNVCTYCGFSMENKIRRKTLNMAQLEAEARAIKKLGFEHILLVTGESEQKVGMAYFEQVLKLLRNYFSHISMEIQPLSTDDYRQLGAWGVESILIYQETYHRRRYTECHTLGPKADFDFRLATPERVGEAGINKLGIGCLLGLEDWRTEAFHVAMHLTYLEQVFWKMRFSISFPRLRPCEGGAEINSPITDRQLVQLICAYRLFNHQVELSLSTRESAVFRDNMLQLGITSMSAGSKTQPGGYARSSSELEQFSIDDDRDPATVARMIKSRGYEPVWKDWQPGLTVVSVS